MGFVRFVSIRLGIILWVSFFHSAVLVDKTGTNGSRLQRLISSTHRNGATMYVIPLPKPFNQSVRS